MTLSEAAQEIFAMWQSNMILDHPPEREICQRREHYEKVFGVIEFHEALCIVGTWKDDQA